MTSSSKTIKIFLDSQQSNSPDTPYETTWNISNSLLDHSNQFSVTLESAIFNNSVYPINEFNNKLYLKVGATSYTLTIAPNKYTGTELATYLQTQISSLTSKVFACSYSSQSQKMTLAIALPDTFQIMSGVNQINKFLGYSTTGTTALSSHVSANPINIAGSNYVDISVYNMPNSTIHSNKLSSVLYRIPLDVPFGSMINFTNYSNNQDLLVSHDSFYNIKMRLSDDQGRLFKLASNTNLSIVLNIQAL